MKEQKLKKTLYKTNIKNLLPSQELIEILKECKSLLETHTFTDNSGYCKSLIDEVNMKIN
jgi:hypothetical protein